jgi:hypothetical protein
MGVDDVMPSRGAGDWGKAAAIAAVALLLLLVGVLRDQAAAAPPSVPAPLAGLVTSG